jgi:hypothetical protein
MGGGGTGGHQKCFATATTVDAQVTITRRVRRLNCGQRRFSVPGAWYGLVGMVVF